MRSRICFLLALVALAAHPDGTALAQTPPASCKPNAGGTQECAPEFPGPYMCRATFLRDVRLQ